MKTILWAMAILIVSAGDSFGSDPQPNVKGYQSDTLGLDSPATEIQESRQASGGNTTAQNSRHRARTNVEWMSPLADGTGICLALAASLTAAAIWHRSRPYVVVRRYEMVVEQAEANCRTQSERTQQALRLAVKRLHSVQCALAKRCRWHRMTDRVPFFLANPATVRLRDAAQDILGRAEFGIGLSLLSQEITVQKAASAMSGTWARRLASSCVVAREREQFLTNLRDEAICHLKAAVALAPHKDEYLYALAQAYELAERNEDSLAAIQSAITLNPSVDQYYRVLASVAWKTGIYRLYNQGLLGIVESSGRSSHKLTARTAWLSSN
jgi:tetratricopeptide (TPR) repeat protein